MWAAFHPQHPPPRVPSLLPGGSKDQPHLGAESQAHHDLQKWTLEKHLGNQSRIKNPLTLCAPPRRRTPGSTSSSGLLSLGVGAGGGFPPTSSIPDYPGSCHFRVPKTVTPRGCLYTSQANPRRRCLEMTIKRFIQEEFYSFPKHEVLKGGPFSFHNCSLPCHPSASSEQSGRTPVSSPAWKRVVLLSAPHLTPAVSFPFQTQWQLCFCLTLPY